MGNNQDRLMPCSQLWQQAVVEANLAPKQITTPEFQGLTSYAYHLDAKKFAIAVAVLRGLIDTM